MSPLNVSGKETPSIFMEIDKVLEVAKQVHHQSIKKKQTRAHHPRVGLVYDDRMCQHFDPKVENHPEKPDRIKAIWAKLESHGVTQRHDFGKFYPFTDDGSHSMIGEGSGTGYNVNVPWEQGECGDADYLAVWDHVLIPITKAFNPDMILISGGFDAAAGDTMGGCSVTPNGYSVLMKKLMQFARGRIMMALEGGYNLESLSNSVLACVEALLENKPIIGSSKAEASPLESAWRVIEAVCRELSGHWPMLSDELPNTIKNKRKFSSEEMGKHGRLGSKDGTNNAKLKRNKITSHSSDVSASNRGISLCPGDQSAGISEDLCAVISPRLVSSVPDFQPFFERGAIRSNEPYVLVRGFWVPPSHSELYATIADDHGHMPNYAVCPDINILVVSTHSLLDTAAAMAEVNIIPSAEKLKEWKQLIDVSKLMGFNIDWMEDPWEEINAKANARVAQLLQIIANSREHIKQCEAHLESRVAAHQRALKEAADSYEKMQQIINTMATQELLVRDLKEELHSVRSGLEF